jgi:2-hydroxyacyl-CoA lyase 1
MAGGIGFEVRTPEELKKATEEGFKAKVPVVVNVIVDPQADLPMVSIYPLLFVSMNYSLTCSRISPG